MLETYQIIIGIFIFFLIVRSYYKNQIELLEYNNKDLEKENRKYELELDKLKKVRNINKLTLNSTLITKSYTNNRKTESETTITIFDFGDSYNPERVIEQEKTKIEYDYLHNRLAQITHFDFINKNEIITQSSEIIYGTNKKNIRIFQHDDEGVRELIDETVEYYDHKENLIKSETKDYNLSSALGKEVYVNNLYKYDENGNEIENIQDSNIAYYSTGKFLSKYKNNLLTHQIFIPDLTNFPENNTTKGWEIFYAYNENNQLVKSQKKCGEEIQETILHLIGNDLELPKVFAESKQIFDELNISSEIKHNSEIQLKIIGEEIELIIEKERFEI